MMAASTLTPLKTPIVDGGIWSVHFVNGLVLSADKLSDEQAANRKARLQLGEAIGAGVAYGLEVTKAVSSDVLQPTVTVASGLAVNRLGQTLELTSRTDVALARPEAPGTQPGALDFTDCPTGAASSGTYRAGSGLFVFAIGPSESTSGRAVVSGLGNDAPTCATAYSIEGVQFRLLRVLVDDQLLDDEQLLRNRVAYRFLGTASPARRALERAPFGAAVTSYGVDDLWDGCLSAGEVPLGLVYWTAAGGIESVDRWAVRRRLAAAAASAGWPLLAGDRVEREGEAMLLQFQDQLDDIRTTEGHAATLRAAERFQFLPPIGLIPPEFLPPAGLVPLDTPGEKQDPADRPFFGSLTVCEPVYIEGASVQSLVREAFAQPPIELATEEAIRLYCVRENEQSVGGGPVATRPYTLFANGHCIYRGDAQFDLSYWDFANFAQDYC